ncbi:MAG: hypothetical protein WC979_09310 [Candidatus Pacearchaeota archaeon]|jgi:hypothetical protein
MRDKKMVKMKKNCLLFSVIILGLVVINCFGIVLAATDVSTMYAGTSINTLLKGLNDPSLSIDTLNKFKVAWKETPLDRRKVFIDNLGTNKNEFFKSVLKSKYKKIQNVELGDANFDLDENLNNVIVRDDKGKEFKIPVNNPDARKISLVGINNENQNVQLVYDTIQTGKSADYRTLTIDPGFEGSINPTTGNYVDKDGKETNVNVLYGKGGKISLSMSKEGKPYFGIGKLDVSKLTPEQKANYEKWGVAGLTNTALVKIGDNFYYGSVEGDSIFEPEGDKVKLLNGEVAAVGKNSEGKDATLAYIKNSGESIFNPTTGSNENIVDGEIRFIKPSEGSPSIVLGNKVNSDIKLYSDFEDVGHDGSLASANIVGTISVNNNQNQKLFEINNGQISAQPYSKAAEGYDIEDSEEVAGGSQMQCDGQKCRFIPGRPVLNAGILAARGVGAVARGVGTVIQNRPVLSFFQNRRPVRTLIGGIIQNRPIRTFFAERQPVRRLVGGIIRAQPLRRAGGAILGGGGRIIGGAGRIIAFPFRRR